MLYVLNQEEYDEFIRLRKEAAARGHREALAPLVVNGVLIPQVCPVHNVMEQGVYEARTAEFRYACPECKRQTQ